MFSENTEVLPVFSIDFEYLLLFENFGNIENCNFFSSFKAFFKRTPVARIGNFKTTKIKGGCTRRTSLAHSKCQDPKLHCSA